jgi:hypothetical protein
MILDIHVPSAVNEISLRGDIEEPLVLVDPCTEGRRCSPGAELDGLAFRHRSWKQCVEVSQASTFLERVVDVRNVGWQYVSDPEYPVAEVDVLEKQL